MARKVIKMKKPAGGSEAEEPTVSRPGGSMERLHKEISQILQSRGFATMEEANEFLQDQLRAGEFNHLLDGPLAGPVAGPLDGPGGSGGPEEEAQELCWQAMEAPSFQEADRLFRRALQIDPDCTDALVFKSQKAGNAGAAVEMLERANLSAAERLGGGKYFRENMGHFWGLVETRPYMRAKNALATAYREAGRQLDAIAEYEHMLELCPNDNIGVRYLLLGLYLRVGDLYRARRLMKEYGNEASTVFLYGAVFLEILEENYTKAKRILKQAKAANRHVFEYLAGMREKMPEAGPTYGPGDESEAGVCLDCLHEAFLSSPSIMMWMLEQGPRGEGGTPPLFQ